MAGDARQPRIALAVAVVVVLLAAVGVLLQQRRSASAAPGIVEASVLVGPAGAALTFNGIDVVVPPNAVPAGTRLSAREAGEPDVPALAPMTRRAGGGVRLSFDGGLRPRLPVRVRFPVAAAPAKGLTPVLIAGAHLVPATYDAAAHRFVADVPQLSGLWAATLDFTVFGHTLLSTPAPVRNSAARPACAGEPASAGGVTVEIGGNFAADQSPAVWPCVTLSGGRASVTLTSNASVPYRIDVPPGWPEPGMTTVAPDASVVQRAAQLLPRGGARYRDLLTAGAGFTFDIGVDRLPATVRGQADPGPYLGIVLAWTARGALDAFGVPLGALADLEKNADITRCAADAGSAHYAPGRPFATVLADVWHALRPCVSAGAAPDAAKVFDLVGGAIDLITSGLEPAVRGVAGFDIPLTAIRGTQRYTQTADYKPWAANRVASSIRTTPASGTCWTVSAVSGRHDAYRCSTTGGSGNSVYDPCFASTAANARQQVVCPTAAAKAVLLTLTDALPSPPQEGGLASPFLLVLDGGLQCAGFIGDSPPVAGETAHFACADQQTFLYGDPNAAKPEWTIQATANATPPLHPMTITKVYQ